MQRRRPNWRKEGEYPYPDKTSPRQWAWEFLRRNPEYLRLWNKRIKPNYNSARFNQSWQEVLNRKSPGRRTRLRLQASGPPPFDAFKVKFGIVTEPPPPWEPEAKLLFKSHVIQYEAGSATKSKISGQLKPGQIVMWFELDLPIEAQIENAKQVLKARRAEYKKPSKDPPRIRANKYRNYLRVLDAREKGVPRKTIASVIYPKLSNGRQRVTDDTRAASRLRDSDYLQIAGVMK